MNHTTRGVDYAAFLARHDMLFTAFPDKWDEAPFLGNGMLGAMVYRESPAEMRIDLGHSLVYDHREGEMLFNGCRLPVGHFAWTFQNALTACDLRLRLHKAELSGAVRAGAKKIGIQAIVHAEQDLLLVRFKNAPSIAQWITFVPAKAISPRQVYGIKYGDTSRILPEYEENPPPYFHREGEVYACIQPLAGDWTTVTAWRWISDGEDSILAATVVHTAAGEDAFETALHKLSFSQPLFTLWTSHRRWWADYYAKSFLSLPDTALEGFYWIQLYKLASATRPDGVIMDNQGPWLQSDTPWPAIWWNLNVQLAYSPVFAANHPELFTPVWRTLRDCTRQLSDNVPEPYRHDSAALGTNSDYRMASQVKAPGEHATGLVEAGNLTWALHSCWLYYRMTMDETFLRKTLYPLLQRSVSYVLHYTYEKDDVIHILPTASPEYGVVAPDTTYELALLRWGLETLLFIVARFDLDEPRAEGWRDTLERLAPYPVHASEGYMIAAGVRYERSHRHYSHLLMAYPLYLVNREQPGAKALIERTIAHWQSMKEALQGYSCTGSASLYAALGMGDEALSHLRGLWSGFLRYNTMYLESGPVIETPLAATQSIQDMLLQSWGGKIRVFPAVPTAWQDVVFENWRAEGGFLVSARRTGGETRFIRITSLAGEPCFVETDADLTVVDKAGESILRKSENTYVVILGKGECMVLCGNPVENIHPLAPDPAFCNCYGKNERTESVIFSPREDNRID